MYTAPATIPATTAATMMTPVRLNAASATSIMLSSGVAGFGTSMIRGTIASGTGGGGCTI